MQDALNLRRLDQGYAEGAIPARVEFTNRFSKANKLDFVCQGLFFIGLIAHLGLGIWMTTNARATLSSSGIELDESVFEEVEACGGNRLRALQLSAGSTCPDLWCLFAKATYIPIVTIGVTPLLGAVWIALMYKFSFAMTWACILFNAIFFMLIGIAGLQAGIDSTVSILFLALSGVLLLFYYFTREKINQASRHLKTSCFALSKNLNVFVATGVLELALLGYLALHWFFMIQAPKVVEVDSTFCTVNFYPEKVQKMTQFMTLMLVWIIAYLNSTKLVVTAMMIGTWFFEQEDRPSTLARTSLYNALTASGGAVSIGSVITAIVENIIRKATSYFWWSDPLGCVLKLFFVCLHGCIMALTRFAVVSHAFTGEGFFDSSKRVFKVLKRNFVGGYVLSRVGVMVVRTGANALCMAIGLLAWFWIDEDNNWSTLSDVTEVFGGLLGFLGFVLLYLVLIRRPLLTIFLITLLMELISSSSLDEQIFAPIGGVFVSCVAAIILNFQGDVVLDSLDTIFLAFAVRSEAGTGFAKTGDQSIIYTLMHDDVPEAIEVKPGDGIAISQA